MWDDLNWLFRLHHGDTLTLTVLSGELCCCLDIFKYRLFMFVSLLHSHTYRHGGQE